MVYIKFLISSIIYSDAIPYIFLVAYSKHIIDANLVIGPSIHFTIGDEILVVSVSLLIDFIYVVELPVVKLGSLADV
jgi:hypothetical protein